MALAATLRRRPLASLGLDAAIAILGLVLIGVDLSRFLHATPRLREKDLSFLPAPVVGRILALGHDNTVAKLRWIDSFAYFEHLLAIKDDTVPGEAKHGVERLYRTLLALDPHFKPFYLYATLNASGILNHHQLALSFFQQATTYFPHDSELWRNEACEWQVFFDAERNDPAVFDQFLSAWQDAETTVPGKYSVMQWKKSLAVRHYSGAEQLPYWFAQLASFPPHTTMGDYVEGVIREQLSRYGQTVLQRLVDADRVRRGWLPPDFAVWLATCRLADPFLVATARDRTRVPPPASLDAVLDPRLLRSMHPAGLPSFAPFAVVDGRLQLRSDPYGYPWVYQRGRVLSHGAVTRAFERQIADLDFCIVQQAKSAGHWPASLDEVRALGIAVPAPPYGGRLVLRDHQLDVVWPADSVTPWQLR